MATVVVCDRCGARLPAEADAALVLTTATERFDLCPACWEDLHAFLHTDAPGRRMPAQVSE